MLRVDRLRLRLPPGYEHRATEIARLVGHKLAAVSASGATETISVAVSAKAVGASTTNEQMAAQIVRAISAGLGER